jgi:hypothetical protein
MYSNYKNNINDYFIELYKESIKKNNRPTIERLKNKNETKYNEFVKQLYKSKKYK